jgi:tRNA modification GTPase
VDTAGLRETDNPVEREGIRRSERVIEGADIVLYVVDGTEGLKPEDGEALEKFGTKPVIKVWNKIDLADLHDPQAFQESQGTPAHGEFVEVSSMTGEGLPSLYSEMARILLEGTLPPKDDLVIDSERQRDLLLRASDALSHVREGLEEGVSIDAVAMDVRDALDALGEIVGQVSQADMLTDMFSRFCVGK